MQTRVPHSPFTTVNTVHYLHTNENKSHLTWNVNDFPGIDANNLKRKCDIASLEAFSFPFKKEITFDHYHY